jgi:PAS domain S-box-containing protein
MKYIKHLTLNKKFILGVGIIVVVFWCMFSMLIYVALKDTIIEETHEKTEILFSHIKATIKYTREKLRPKLYTLLPDKTFVAEAMSVSFINKQIMEEFKKDFPDFIYRRVAINPMNPSNRPDHDEIKFINMFKEQQDSEWKGIVNKSGNRYFLHVRPIVMRGECLLCHGNPKDAPPALIKIYGTSGGFYRKVGDVIGIESIAIPLGQTLQKINDLVLSIFLMGLIGVAFLFLSLNYLINRVAVKPIKTVSRFFKSVVEGQQDLNTRLSVKSRDEIGELASSFNQMMQYLKNSQEQIRISERKYRRIFEGSKDTILLADCDGFILDINPSGLEMFGCKDKSRLIKEKTLYDLFINPQDYTAFLNVMEKKGFVRDYETKLRGEDSKEIDVLITANYRREEDGKICGYEAIIKDITEWKRLQQQLQQTDRLASIGELAAGVAHEINNPLGIIMGYAGILLNELKENPSLREDIEKIYRNAEVCKRIVEDLLKFSRRTETKPELYNMNQLINEVTDMIGYRFDENNIKIKKELDESIPEIYVDTEKMRQVIMNILINAIQAIKHNGIITIKTTLNRENRKLIISISDSGTGIPEDIVGKIFEPFFTTKQPGEGTGLGLSVSYGIVKEHNGDIRVESRRGKGTTFHIILPAEGVHLLSVH